MAFDPSTAVLDKPPAFDPHTAVLDGPHFDAASAVIADPADRMRELAPKVSSFNADPKDDAAYKAAYLEYYNQNSTISRLGETAGAPLTREFWKGAAGGLWHMAKATAQGVADTANELGMGPAGMPVPTAGQLLALGQGGVAGLAKLGTGAMSLMSAAGDQWSNMETDVTGDPEHRMKAAENALTRLKLEAKANQLLANPYAPGSREGGYFNTGQAAASLAPFPAVDVAGAAKLVQGAGDVIGKIGNEALGATLQAMGKAGPVGAEAIKYGGLATAVVTHPTSIPTLVTAHLLNGEIPTHVSLGTAIKSPAIRSGLFQGVDTLGRMVRTTPLGQSAIDSLVQNSPAVLAQSTADTKAARAAVANAKRAYNVAQKAGQSVSPFARQLRVAQKASAAAEANQFMLEKGAQFAQWLQGGAAQGIQRNLANALGGVIVGGAMGGAVANLQGQPGPNPGAMGAPAALGAGFGLILGQLGQAALASPPSPSVLRQEAEKLATNRFEPEEPGAAAVAGAPGPTPPPPRLDSIILDGVPHPAEVVAENLRTQGQELLRHIKQEAPINETYDLPWISTREMGKWGGMPHPGDSVIRELLAAHQPIDSSAIYAGFYHPDRQMASVFFRKGKASGNFHHYVFGQVTPEDWAGLMAGEGHDGSIGKAFNGWFRNEYPYGEVKQPPSGGAEPPAN